MVGNSWRFNMKIKANAPYSLYILPDGHTSGNNVLDSFTDDSDNMITFTKGAIMRLKSSLQECYTEEALEPDGLPQLEEAHDAYSNYVKSALKRIETDSSSIENKKMY